MTNCLDSSALMFALVNFSLYLWRTGRVELDKKELTGVAFLSWSTTGSLNAFESHRRAQWTVRIRVTTSRSNKHALRSKTHIVSSTVLMAHAGSICIEQIVTAVCVTFQILICNSSFESNTHMVGQSIRRSRGDGRP